MQNSSACARNPVALDVVPARIHLLRGGGIAALYRGNGVDVGIRRHTVTVFAGSARQALEAARELRRREVEQPPARYAPPAYPAAVLRELKRVVIARKHFHTIRALAQATGLPRDAIRSRLRLARLLGGALAGVKAPTRSWAAVERDRQVAFEARELGEARTARRLGISRAQLSRVILRVRGLTGDC